MSECLGVECKKQKWASDDKKFIAMRWAHKTQKFVQKSLLKDLVTWQVEYTSNDNMVHIVTFEQTTGVITLVRNDLSDYNTMIDILKDEMECHVLEI